MAQLLNIVDENDEIIGVETREAIHAQGLRHRETHVFFVTPQRELIFQHRAPNKDTYPDLLDATVGGHVEIGDSYLETAIKETREETGVMLEASDLILINKIFKRGEDKLTGKINNVVNTRYAYIFRGQASDLKIEACKAVGFEVWPLCKLISLSESEANLFIPYILELARGELREFVNQLNF